jgi:hypothetical protein
MEDTEADAENTNLILDKKTTQEGGFLFYLCYIYLCFERVPARPRVLGSRRGSV